MAVARSAASGREPSSFRDDRGHIYYQGGRLLRQINSSGRESYDKLMNDGLYDALVKAHLLIAHKELNSSPATADVYKIIEPDLVPFISYPYEWSFSQLRDAALATLAIQKLAMTHGMELRDASAYNIQFVDGRPTMIDTLSFDVYEPGRAWVAYRQFCQHFLAPLALMSYVDPALLQLMRVYIDGVPLPLAARLLPRKASFRAGLFTHIGLHARAQNQKQNTHKKVEAKVSRNSLIALIASLDRAVRGLKLADAKTEWGDYYNMTNYSDSSFAQKAKLVADLAKPIKPKVALDLGSNNGHFSRVVAKASDALVLSADIDPMAVEKNYRTVREHKETNILPLLIDLTNPSPALGWNNQERASFTQRAKSDLVIALALIHHLAIANNLPLPMIAGFMAELAPELIIEFVPKEDSQVAKLISTREDIFPDYNVAGFEQAFGQRYVVKSKHKLSKSDRILYHMSRKSA